MTADIRMALENELDGLDDSTVEGWIKRCFEACDPRFDTDWLLGMFELALMQFPDNYEVRAASSKASTMEAQRLYDEGEVQEAVSRLERLLESDPYCTDAFEMLERFMQQDEPQEAIVAEQPELPPQSLPPEPLPAEAELPLEVAAVSLAPAIEEEPLDFLVDDLNIAELALPDAIANPTFLPPPAPAPEDWTAQAPAAAPAPAATQAPAPELPPTPEPAPVAMAVEAPVVALAPPPALAPVPAPTPLEAPAPEPIRVSAFDWRSVVSLPGDGPARLAPLLEDLLPSLTERFTQVRSYRSLVLLLTDLYQRDSSHQGVAQQLNHVLQDWSAHLEQQGRGNEAGQVAAWSQQLLGSSATWAAEVVRRFPTQAPALPDLALLGGLANPAWMNWVNPLKEDPLRFEEAGQSLSQDPQGLQSLFRHLAVHFPNHPDHVLNLGWAYSQTNQHALAMVHTQRSLQLQASTRGLQLLHKVYQDLGQPDMAARAAQQLAGLSGS